MSKKGIKIHQKGIAKGGGVYRASRFESGGRDMGNKGHHKSNGK